MVLKMFLLILSCVILNCDLLTAALMITDGPRNATVCSGNKTEMPCGFISASVLDTPRPDWRIIKRNNNGNVISNETVSGQTIQNNKTDGLVFFTNAERRFSANGSLLVVGPVDDTYNNTSYQCIFTINDTIIESDTVGTITVIGAPSSPVLTYKSTVNEILVSWSPVGSDTVCGLVTYNITVIPSHGMIMTINDTLCNITGLNNETAYTITVYATNNAGDGEPTVITVNTKSLSGSSSSSSDSSGGDSNTGLIAGIVGGVVAAVLGIIILVIICIVIRQKKKGAAAYNKEAFKSHALAASDQTPITHDHGYYQMKDSKQSGTEEYAVFSKLVGSTSEKQQQQASSVEYAETINNKNRSPQQHILISGYEMSENIVITPNKQVSQTPVMEYAKVDKSKKQTSQEEEEEEEPSDECDDAVVENEVAQINYAELQNLPTNVRGCTIDKDATTVYTQVV